MAKYVGFYTYTPEAWGGMIENPPDRAAAAGRLIEGLGGTLESFYWMFGPYDGLLIADFPNAEAAGAFAAIVTSSGRLKLYETHQLIGMDEARTMLEKAKGGAGAYQRPGT
jgi:uncharacterized protein with GYD domain